MRASTTKRENPGAAPLIEIEQLAVRFGAQRAVDGVSFTLHAGQCLALVGESGSGKSVTARSLLGLSGGTVTADRLRVLGQDGLRLGENGWRTVRGAQIGMVLQDALSALDPLRPVGREISDALRGTRRAERRARMLQMLQAVGMDDPARRAAQRSGELSGGMRQRALIAQALIGDPQVVIADEATTALDAGLTALVLRQLHELKAQGRAVLMISHDLAQVAQVADRIAVMRGGKIVESGPAEELLGAPRHEYTQTLLRAVPSGVPRFTPLAASTPRPAPQPAPAATAQTESRPEPALQVSGLSKAFGGQLAVDDVSFTLPRGATLGIVGESGSGKTTTARMVLGLQRPDAGTVRLLGRGFVPAREAERRPLRRAMGAIYQNPLGSFDPRYTVGALLADALTSGRSRRLSPVRDQVHALLRQVQLDEQLAARYPTQLSGGQRQRLAIARALAPRPAVLVLDEPVSALDVSIQATVLDLLDELQVQTGTSYLFISHDLSVIEHMSDQVAVMYQGRFVENGPTAEVFANPQHPYTQRLLSAVPRLR